MNISDQAKLCAVAIAAVMHECTFLEQYSLPLPSHATAHVVWVRVQHSDLCSHSMAQQRAIVQCCNVNSTFGLTSDASLDVPAAYRGDLSLVCLVTQGSTRTGSGLGRALRPVCRVHVATRAGGRCYCSPYHGWLWAQPDFFNDWLS